MNKHQRQCQGNDCFNREELVSFGPNIPTLSLLRGNAVSSEPASQLKQDTVVRPRKAGTADQGREGTWHIGCAVQVLVGHLGLVKQLWSIWNVGSKLGLKQYSASPGWSVLKAHLLGFEAGVFGALCNFQPIGNLLGQIQTRNRRQSSGVQGKILTPFMLKL